MQKNWEGMLTLPTNQSVCMRPIGRSGYPLEDIYSVQRSLNAIWSAAVHHIT
jgi:hypothetical protein